MRILFQAKNTNAASTVLNRALLEQINKLDSVHIAFFNENFRDYDVVLLMGYDAAPQMVRAENPNAKIGVIDPRPSFHLRLDCVDFILSNGIEMKDWYLSITPNIFFYPIYPVLTGELRKHEDTNNITIGYHGNKVHLNGMAKRVSPAIEALAEKYSVELWAMYNIEKLGKWQNGVPDERKVRVRHIQWDEKNYERYMANVDIGIVPNLLPLRDDEKIKKELETDKNMFLEHDTDYLMRFKATSNMGRAFVFFQYGIPVVADMFPSALQIIEDGETGFVCYSTAAWYYALRRLAEEPHLRSAMAAKMFSCFNEKYAPRPLNKRLVQFIAQIGKTENWAERSLLPLGEHVSSVKSVGLKNIYLRFKRAVERAKKGLS